jgi:uncharacterized protein
VRGFGAERLAPRRCGGVGARLEIAQLAVSWRGAGTRGTTCAAAPEPGRIMNPVGLLLSIAIGVSLGFFGGGGSILTVPLLVYVFGLPPKQAIASSLLVVASASGVAALQHARAGNLRPRVALLFGCAGMAGAYLGARVAAFVAGGVLLLLFAALMGLTALAMWRGRAVPPAASTRDLSPGRLVLQGLAVGSFTGLVGAGGGFLIVPALVLWAGLPMPAAVGTSLLVIVMNSLAGFAGYAGYIRVEPALVVAVAACAIAGSFAGSWLTRLVHPSSLRRAFAGFVLVMAAAILLREGNLVLETGGAALPRTLPQLLFALAMLGIGIAAGRVSRGPRAADGSHLEYEEGAGI